MKTMKTMEKDRLVDNFDGFEIYYNKKDQIYYIPLDYDVGSGKFPHPTNDKDIYSLKVKIREIARRNVPSCDVAKIPRISVGDLQKVEEMRAELIRLDYEGTDKQYAKAAKELDEIGHQLGLPVWRGLKQTTTFKTLEDGSVQYVCEHGIGHTIKIPATTNEDVAATLQHGCDGCCSRQSLAELNQEYELQKH